MTPSSWTERRCDECGSPSAVRIDGRDLCAEHLATPPLPLEIAVRNLRNAFTLLAGGAE